MIKEKINEKSVGRCLFVTCILIREEVGPHTYDEVGKTVASLPTTPMVSKGRFLG